MGNEGPCGLDRSFSSACYWRSSTASTDWIAPTCARRALGSKTTPKKHGGTVAS
jgi:hypothetical protein